MQNWELWIIDDGSTDNTSAVARSFADPRIHVVSEGVNLGLPQRLNQAVSLARGQYFARMDGDDVAYPERLAVQMAYLENHPRVDLVCSRVLIFDRDGRIIGTYPFREDHEGICRRPQAGFYFPHPTWMGRLRWFLSHPYDPANSRSEDQSLLLSTYRNSRFACIPKILLGYRQPRLVLTRILKGRASYSVTLFREALLRRQYGLLFGAVEQFFKGGLECIIIGTGLDYRVLRHRALPVSHQEASQWRELWNTLNPKRDVCVA
jgi:glycosyltransferase involved in cell wall biosynthesis